jgi:hypothetical protein
MGWSANYLAILTASQANYAAADSKEAKAKIVEETVHQIKSKANEDDLDRPHDLKKV